MNKYELYLQAVQEPSHSIDLIENECRKRARFIPQSLGEDFCGTFALSCAWVETGPKRKAVAVDLSLSPINYGMGHYFSSLTSDEQKRLTILQSDVRHPRLPKVDVLCAFNYSYFVFKNRQELLAYFKNCRRRLNRRGLLLLDLFGGSEIMHANCDRLKFPKFTYYWDQVSFDPINHEARFYIHFKEPGKKRKHRAFRYDWRIWSIPELRDLLEEAGFKKTFVCKEKLRKTAWVATLSAVI